LDQAAADDVAPSLTESRPVMMQTYPIRTLALTALLWAGVSTAAFAEDLLRITGDQWVRMDGGEIKTI